MFWLRIKSRTQEIESLRARRAAPRFGESALALRTHSWNVSKPLVLREVSRAGVLPQEWAPLFRNAVRPAELAPRPPSFPLRTFMAACEAAEARLPKGVKRVSDKKLACARHRSSSSSALSRRRVGRRGARPEKCGAVSGEEARPRDIFFPFCVRVRRRGALPEKCAAVFG
jgi:hypothetical protein